MTTNSIKLPVHEWLIVGLIVAIMAAIVTVTFFKSSTNYSEPSKPLILEEIEVKISGAVAKPGYYVLNSSATLQDLFELAEPLPEANTSRLNPKKQLRDGQKIHIPSIPMITIHLEGAVANPGSLIVPKGAKVEDLLDLVVLMPEADKKVLEKKRKLKDGETIKVKFKNEADKHSKTQKIKKMKKKENLACKKNTTLIISLFRFLVYS